MRGLFNLELPGEHGHCGRANGLQVSGFSYLPEDFMKSDGASRLGVADDRWFAFAALRTSSSVLSLVFATQCASFSLGGRKAPARRCRS